MPRWPSQPAAEPAAKRARKNAVKDMATTVPLPDPHHSIVEALSGAEGLPEGVRDMLCAGLGGCLASVGTKKGRHPHQDRILGLVVDSLEVAEASVVAEVAEAEVALEASQAEMALCEEAKKVLEVGLAESDQNIDGREKALEESADTLEKTRHELGCAETALRRADTEIGEAAMRSHQISQVLRLVTSLSDKGAPDGEAAKFLEDNQELIEPFVEHLEDAPQDPEQHVAEELAAEDLAVEESVHKQPCTAQIASGETAVEQSASEQKLADAPRACDHSSAELSREEQSGTEQLARHLSRFSKCMTELERVISRTAEVRILRVAEVDSAQVACSAMLSKRAEQSSELREVKQVHRQSEVSLKSNAKDLKQILAKHDTCIESRDSAQERLAELRHGPLSTCRRALATTKEVSAIDIVPTTGLKDLCAKPDGEVEMRVELIQAGC